MPRYTTAADTVTTHAAGPREAAEVIARRLYGRRGVVATLRTVRQTEDGLTTHYVAMLGTPNGHGQVDGRDVVIYGHAA